MARVIGIGNESYQEIIEQDSFYIDKTEFIKEWWESRDKATLITRPRRFGKTLNMSMLNCFFSNEYKNRADLFEGLDIWKDEKYREIQGTYPVIFLSFASVKGDTLEITRQQLIKKIVKLYEENRFLLSSDVMSDTEKENYVAFLKNPFENDISCSINDMSDYLSRYYKKKVIILLDEYDTPMQEAYVYGFWEEIVSFIRSLFNATFKTNPYLERAIMTGITRVSKESIFSDLNNLRVVTTTSNEYADCFGFTEQEVFESLDDYNLTAEKEKVKEWYDGFTFGEVTDIYNPWSITNFLKTGKFSTYWADTSSNGLVSRLIRTGTADVKCDMEMLLNGEVIEKEIDEQIVFEQLDKNRNAVWSLLLASGYLKIEGYQEVGRMNKRVYSLKLTNFEIELMFGNMIEQWFGSADIPYNEFVRSLLSGDVESMNIYMEKITKNIMSYFDSGKQPSEEEPERFYHGLVLGLMVDQIDNYIITSNRESGFGRYDIMLEPRDKDNTKYSGIVIEFKVINPRKEKTLEETVEAALKQIEEKDYDTELISRGVKKENIRHYGFAFRGKEVLIG